MAVWLVAFSVGCVSQPSPATSGQQFGQHQPGQGYQGHQHGTKSPSSSLLLGSLSRCTEIRCLRRSLAAGFAWFATTLALGVDVGV